MLIIILPENPTCVNLFISVVHTNQSIVSKEGSEVAESKEGPVARVCHRSPTGKEICKPYQFSSVVQNYSSNLRNLAAED